MKLYLHPAAPNCIKVVVTAALLDIALDTEVVDLFSDAQRQPGYLETNPNGLVPSLRDGDFVLWESNAIMQYLAASEPGNVLWPADEKIRADVVRWQFWELAHWTPAVSAYLRENLFKKLKGLGDPNTDELRKADANFHPLACLLNAHLAKRGYLVGDGLTLADISVAAFLSYARPARVPLDDYPYILRWLERLNELPAWKRAQPTLAA